MSRIGRASAALVISLAVLAGCSRTAAVGAAGAAAGIFYSDRGAESYVDASVAETAAASEAALRSLGVTLPERRIEPGAREAEIEARYGDHDVSVDLEWDEDADATHVHVTARENVVDYDRDVAERVLREILRRLD